MIKRPLLFMAAVYIIGIISYQGGRIFFLICLLLLNLFVFLSSIIFSKHIFRRYGDWFILLLPVFLGLGFIRIASWSESCDAENFFDLAGNGKIIGVAETIKGASEKYQVILRNSRLFFKGEWKSCNGILVYLDNIHSDREGEMIRHGNTISVTGKWLPLSRASNPGQFDEFIYFQQDHISFKMLGSEVQILNKEISVLQDALYRFKEYLISGLLYHLPEKEAGILSLMLFSEKSLIDEEMKLLYQNNGIAHILAISGLHISLLGMGLFRILRKLYLPMAPSILCVSIFLFLYGILTNFSVSATRAILMILISFGAIILGKSYDMLSALAFSALFVLIREPASLYSAGFQLSFLAIFGISVIYPVMERLFLTSKRKRWLSPLFSSISVTLSTLPVILYHFFEWPLYSILLNLLVLPFLSVVVLFGLCAAVLGEAFLGAGYFLSGPVYYLLLWFESVCRFTEMLPFHTLLSGRPAWPTLVVYYLLLFVFLTLGYRKKEEAHKKFCRLAFLLPIFGFVICFYHPDSVLRIWFLDVGQGDGIYIQSEGVSILVDGGSSTVKEVGKYRIIPFLKYQGKAVINYCFLTHLDADHRNGIEEILMQNQIIIQNLVVPRAAVKEEHWFSIQNLAKEKQVNLYVLEAEQSLEFGKLKLDCIHPEYAFEGSSNAASLVLSLSYGEFDLLLTGDLEAEGESVVADILRGSQYDLLKVAHHGSKNSTNTSFLEAVSVKTAIISSGKGNSYGHPHKETMDRLRYYGVETLLLMNCGAVEVTSNGEWMEYVNFLSPLH